MNNKGLDPILWMVVAIVVFIAALGVSLWWTQLTKGQVPWLFEVLEGMFKNLLGVEVEANDLLIAAKCAYHRCAIGCNNIEITRINFGGKNCKDDFCKPDWDLDGDSRICNEESESNPVTISTEENLILGKFSPFEELYLSDCEMYGGLVEVTGKKYLDIDKTNVVNDNCKVDWAKRVEKTCEITSGNYFLWMYLDKRGTGGYPYYFTIICRHEGTSVFVYLEPYKWSSTIRIWPMKAIVITKDGQSIDRVVLRWTGIPYANSFEVICKDKTKSTITLKSLGESTFVCKDKFVINQISNDKVKVIYANKILFYPSEVAPGETVTASVTLDNSYLGKQLQLMDKCPRVGIGGGGEKKFAECTVSKLQPAEPPSCQLQFTATEDTPSKLVLCEFDTFTGYIGLLTVKKPACECNAGNTGCKNSFCEGCAKCGIVFSSPVCYNGEWRSSTYEGYSTYGSCCDIDDCLENFEKCYNDGFGWRCLYGSPIECDDTVCQYNEVNCGNSQSECDTYCSPSGCGA